MTIQNIPVSKLTPYKGNPRFNDEAMRNVANSIKAFGFKVPIVVDKNGVIVAGHTRYKAAKYLGMKEVPCIVADDLSDEQIKAFRIADNSTNEVASWDSDLLRIELDEIENFDMSDFGLDFDADDKEQDEEQSENKSKSGIEKKMELRAFEHYDYLVFVFDNQFDFMNMAQEFGIERVDAGYSNRKIGIGRIVKGAELVKRIGHQSSDIESEPLEFDID